jgi:integrase
MATIIAIPLKTGGVSFKAVIKKDGKVLTSKRWSTRKLVLDWSDRIEHDHETMEALDSGMATMSFDKLADEYLAWWRKQNRKDKGTPARVDWWKDQFKKKKLIDISSRHIRAILKTYAEGKAKRGNGPKKSKVTTRPRTPATVNRHRAGLSAIFKYARTEGYIVNNPVSAVASLPENNKRVRWLSDDERKALLTACKASEWHKLHLLVLMALTTGARLGEMLGLKWSDIDFEDRTAILHTTKNGESRVLTLAPVTIKALLPFREVGAGLVFPGVSKPKKPGQPKPPPVTRPFEFRPHWEKAMETAKIDNFRFHDLRHSAASYLVMNGATLHECAEALGHKSVETTKRYAHLSVEHKQALTDRVMTGLFDD